MPPAAHSGHDIIVIGASAGGVEAISKVVAGLPADLPAAVFVVLHVMSTGTSVLPQILGRVKTLPAEHAVDGDHIEHGRIYVAPPNRHLLVDRGRIHVSTGPKENGHRPAIDPLFRSAARAYESRVVGVVLSGVLDDGSAGLLNVKMHGGATIAQDPEDALYPSMPANAIAYVRPDLILPLDEIADALVELAHEPARAELVQVAAGDSAPHNPGTVDPQPGEPSGFTCPDCGGALWELEEGNLLRFRCRIGHQYSTQSLFAEQSEAVGTALWSALRALEERAALNRRISERLAQRGNESSAMRSERRAQDADRNSTVLREALESFEAARELDIEVGEAQV